MIDLLSGIPKLPGPPPASSGVLYTNQYNVDGLPPKHPSAPTATGLSAASKAVGSHLSHALPAAAHPSRVPPGAGVAAGFPSHMFNHPPPQLPADLTGHDPSGLVAGQRAHQHRRSDGLIGETIQRGSHKTNTWPYRPHQRMPDMTAPSTATATLPPYSAPPMSAYDGHISDAEYSRYRAAVKQMKHNSQAASAVGPVLPQNNPWSTGENNLNRSWPLHMFSQDG